MTSPPRRITARQFHDALAAAGVIRGNEFYRRIVIDAQTGQAVVIYAERYADERLLDVALTLDGIEVRHGEPAEGPDAPAGV
jgi:hypothetical protein